MGKRKPLTADERKAKNEAVANQYAQMAVEAIEKGIANPKGWTAPWHTPVGPRGVTNVATGKRYTGGNAMGLSLWLAMGKQGPWGTYRQWESKGAQVRKGEHGIPLLRPSLRKKEVEDKQTGEKKLVTWTVFVGFTVFGADQVDGYVPPEEPETVTEGERHAAADAWIAQAESVLDIRWSRDDRAYYAPGQDYLSLPEYDMYKRADQYYSTCWHEMGHATGHKSRVGRPQGGVFGSVEYGKEELVAELTAATMGHEFGITTELADHNRDYLANWLQVLRGEPGALWDAANAAAKAASWLLENITVDGGVVKEAAA